MQIAAMSSHIVQELLFNLVKSDRLIFEATCWRRNDGEINDPIPPPKRKPYDARYYKKAEFKDSDHIAVDLVLRLIDALEVPNCIAKNKECEEAKNVNHIKAFVPQSLLPHWIDLWAKNAEWKKYEAALLATGFIINEGCQDLFEKVMFENKQYVDGAFSPQYFPLFQRFQENYRLLSNSGLFESTYEGYYHQKAKSLDIVNWFEIMELDVPAGMIERVRKFQSPVLKSVVENEPQRDTPIHVKERSSMLTLIHAMASGKYKYRQGESLGPAKKAIYLAVQDSGLELSERTIGDYLKSAQEEVDRLRDKKM